MSRQLTPDEQMSYLTSFLLLLVYRAGGAMRIEHLSEIAGKALLLRTKPDFENDAVTLTVEEAKTCPT